MRPSNVAPPPGSSMFRIPMRGYESERVPLRGGDWEFRIPMRGYEITVTCQVCGRVLFRIPMRGYESLIALHCAAWQWVPNPHEGL